MRTFGSTFTFPTQICHPMGGLMGGDSFCGQGKNQGFRLGFTKKKLKNKMKFKILDAQTSG